MGVDFNRRFHQMGAAPAGFLTFGIPSKSVQKFRWCGQNTNGGDLLNFNLESGFDSVSPKGFNGHTFSLRQDRLQQLADQQDIDIDMNQAALQKSFWRSRALIRMDRRLSLLSQQTVSGPQVETLDAEEILNYELPLLVIETLHQHKGIKENSVHHSRTVLQRALDILEDPINLPISVAKLTVLADTSQSTLKRAFQQQLGLSPKAYIRARCLSSVRDQLSTSPPETLIADVANQWGFWHMGQFAADYRKMFGELPSETLTGD
jgi:AraC-like DNA-binding protein